MQYSHTLWRWLPFLQHKSVCACLTGAISLVLAAKHTAPGQVSRAQSLDAPLLRSASRAERALHSRSSPASSLRLRVSPMRGCQTRTPNTEPNRSACARDRQSKYDSSSTRREPGARLPSATPRLALVDYDDAQETRAAANSELAPLREPGSTQPHAACRQALYIRRVSMAILSHYHENEFVLSQSRRENRTFYCRLTVCDIYGAGRGSTSLLRSTVIGKLDDAKFRDRAACHFDCATVSAKAVLSENTTIYFASFADWRCATRQIQ